MPKRKKSPFYLRSGNNTSFKEMGSSPIKQNYTTQAIDTAQPGGELGGWYHGSPPQTYVDGVLQENEGGGKRGSWYDPITKFFGDVFSKENISKGIDSYIKQDVGGPVGTIDVRKDVMIEHDIEKELEKSTTKDKEEKESGSRTDDPD